ncbi:polyunsaturated fatty acid 5-lipoxygenase-like isoform X1 [Montipora capricornis]|uniref:polyunsaturated fatty acid 5-lipoxygenase-like isoform X1 n=2 Tax=Montipora capricornis TaxID=246305 RepID=UPI0035F13837
MKSDQIDRPRTGYTPPFQKGKMNALLSILALLTISRYSEEMLCDVSLPQHANPACKETRDQALAQNQKTYTLKYDPALYGYARLNMTPQQLAGIVFKDPFARYYATAYTQTLRINEDALTKYIADTSGMEINQTSDYLPMSEFFQSLLEPLVGQYAKLPSKYEAFINNKPDWISDKHFAQQRLAGSNPTTLQRVTIPKQYLRVKTVRGDWCHFPFTYRGTTHNKCAQGKFGKWCSLTRWYIGKWGYCAGEGTTVKGETIGLDWNELKKTLNPSFDWQAAVQEALKSRDSLEEAINQGSIFALRYELCDNLPRSPDITDRDPRRKMWDFFSPIALFAFAKRCKELVPVAIQMDFKPDSAVYTPNDGDLWMLAKLNVQITDLGYAQIVEHLGRIHFLMEPFCVSLKRTLSVQHPLNQLLKYHCREILVPNTFGVPNLLGEGKLMDLLFACGNDGAYRMLRESYPLTSWEITDYRNNIKKRGLDEIKVLPYFPYRDDGYQILTVIEALVKDYVDLYYKQDRDIQEDSELQSYLNELSVNGTGPNGGIGKTQGFPASISTKGQLYDILSRIISHVTIYHAPVNYITADYPEYIPNQPTKLYNDTRVGDDEFSVFKLPSRVPSAIQSSAFNTLGVFRFDSLFDYGNELQDHKATNLLNAYYTYLLRNVQPRLQQINKAREESGDLTYPYVIPRWLPNGVQT